MNFLSAVLVGGPPHAGKSVLFYRLTQALRARGVDHYALRACPDGEFHFIEPDQVDTLHFKLTQWPSAFIQSISQSLSHHSLFFLIDMGVAPLLPRSICYMGVCTEHSLAIKEESPEETQSWQQLVETYNLLPLAKLQSRPAGPSEMTASSPLQEEIITRMDRSAVRTGGRSGTAL